ncbi:hypothetical protein ACB092_07G146100 [Castanea dentata]
MPLKNSIETKLGCQERRRGRMGEGRALRKVGFYDPKNNQTYLNVPTNLYFLERGTQPTGTVHDICKKVGVFMELFLNQQIKFN